MQLDHDLITRYHEFLPELSISEIADKHVPELIQELIDRHGTVGFFIAIPAKPLATPTLDTYWHNLWMARQITPQLENE